MSDQRRIDTSERSDRSGSVVVRRLRVDDRDLVAKSGTGRARARLRLEAELLEQLRTAPVVHLVALRESDERTDLVTADAGTHDLTSVTARDPRAGVAVLAAAAHAVDRLHAAGWAHGALCAAHMVVSDSGAVTLCSLGSATRCSARPSAAEEDVLALVRAMRTATAQVDPTWTVAQRWGWRRTARRVRRVLDPMSTSAPAPPAHRPARLLARQLERLVPDSPGPGRVPPQPRLLDTATVRLLGPVLCFAATLIVLGVLRPPTGAADSHAAAAITTSTAATSGAPVTVASRSTTSTCGGAPTGAALDTDGDGCAEQVGAEGNLLRIGDTTLRAGAPGDVVTAAPPGCGAPAAVLSLRPSTGEVFLFGELPEPGDPVTARIVATVPGATSFEVQHEPCTRVALRLAAGPTVALADAVALDPTATTALAPDGATATTPSEEPGP